MRRTSVFSEWNYSKASAAIEKGDYAYAQDLMRTMLVNEPNRPDLLYDLVLLHSKIKNMNKRWLILRGAAHAKAVHCSLRASAF